MPLRYQESPIVPTSSGALPVSSLIHILHTQVICLHELVVIHTVRELLPANPWQKRELQEFFPQLRLIYSFLCQANRKRRLISCVYMLPNCRDDNNCL